MGTSLPLPEPPVKVSGWTPVNGKEVITTRSINKVFGTTSIIKSEEAITIVPINEGMEVIRSTRITRSKKRKRKDNTESFDNPEEHQPTQDAPQTFQEREETWFDLIQEDKKKIETWLECGSFHLYIAACAPNNNAGRCSSCRAQFCLPRELGDGTRIDDPYRFRLRYVPPGSRDPNSEPQQCYPKYFLPQYYHVSCMEFILDFATLARATPEPSCAYNGQSKFLSERGRKMLLRWQAQDYRSDAGVKCSHSRLMADHEGVEQIDNIPRNLLGFLWQPMSEDDYKYINDLDNCFRERDGEPLFLRENGGSTKYSASKSQTSVALSTPSTPLKLTLSQFDFYLQSFITERRKARGPRRCSNEEREWRPLKAEERNALREDLGLSPEAL